MDKNNRLDQVKQILTNWNILQELEINSLKDNSIWSVGDQYILKSNKNIKYLNTHNIITKELNKIGYKASSFIKTKDNQEFFKEDQSYFVLLNKIVGDPLSFIDIYNNYQTIGHKYGQAIGDLHQVLNSLQSGIDLKNSNIYNTVITWALIETKEFIKINGLSDEFYQDYQINFKKLYDKLPRQIIHRDSHPLNIIFDDNFVSGFIDFEISEVNVRIFDICYCATSILTEAKNFENGYEKWFNILSGLIKGYDKVMALTIEEKKAIIYIMYSIQMIFIAWFKENHNLENAKDNYQILIYLYKNNEKIRSLK